MLDVPCVGCGNEKSATVDGEGAGRCAYCLTERAAMLRAIFQNRYRRH